MFERAKPSPGTQPWIGIALRVELAALRSKLITAWQALSPLASVGCHSRPWLRILLWTLEKTHITTF